MRPKGWYETHYFIFYQGSYHSLCGRWGLPTGFNNTQAFNENIFAQDNCPDCRKRLKKGEAKYHFGIGEECLTCHGIGMTIGSIKHFAYCPYSEERTGRRTLRQPFEII